MQTPSLPLVLLLLFFFFSSYYFVSLHQTPRDETGRAGQDGVGGWEVGGSPRRPAEGRNRLTSHVAFAKRGPTEFRTRRLFTGGHYEAKHSAFAHVHVCGMLRQMACELCACGVRLGYGAVRTVWTGTIIHVAPHIQCVLRRSVSIVKKMTGSSVGRARVTALCSYPPTPPPPHHPLHCVSAGPDHPAATEM